MADTEQEISTPPIVDQQAVTEAVEQTVDVPEFSDEQIAAFFKKKNINFDGNFDTLKQKLEYTPPAPEPTDEEKTAKQTEEDKKLLEVFLKQPGATIEQFTALKGMLKEDDFELGKKAAIKEMVDAGLTTSQAEAEYNVRYLQGEMNELSEDDFDSTEEFEEAKALLQKKIDLNKKKIVNKSLYIKKQAEEVFNALRRSTEVEDLQKQKETELSSKVDEYVSKMPRKITFQLGETNGRKLDPIVYDVSENTIAEVAETLKDPSKRNDLLFDKEGNVNVQTVAELIVRNKILENAAKASYLEGESRQVKEFRSIYPANSQYQLGVGGATKKPTTEPGKITKVGQPRVAVPQT